MKRFFKWVEIQWLEFMWNTFKLRYIAKSKLFKLYHGNKLRFLSNYFDISYCDKFTFDEFNNEYEYENILPYDGRIAYVQIDNKFTNIFVEQWGGYIHSGNFDDYRISYDKLKKLAKKYKVTIYWAEF